MMRKKGQGNFLSGDLPSIIMIVLSIGFFLSSIYMTMETFEGKKKNLDMEAALVDSASAFLKENAKITPSDLQSGSEFWALRIEKIERTYRVQTYVEVVSLSQLASDCLSSGDCSTGTLPADNVEVLSKRFPIALKSETTDLEVYPALVKVVVYR